MLLHDQLLLMLAIGCLYLYDSALLLFHNEIVVEVVGRKNTVSVGSPMELRGRHLFVPNPCFPNRALARLSWPNGGSPEWRPTQWKRMQLALSLIVPWTWLLLGLFFIGLPLALRFGTDGLLLLWLALTYLSIVGMLVQVYRYRTVLGLARRAVLALAADALLCAPFALNMVRKISLRQAHAATLHGFASSLLAENERAILAGLLRDRVGISLNHAGPDSETGIQLSAYLDRYMDDRS